MAKDPEVYGGGSYTDTSDGPQQDTGSFDKRTPMGGASYREERQAEEQYVIDDTQKRATPPGMLSRSTLAHRAEVDDRRSAGASNLPMILAGAAVVAVVGLGLVAIYWNATHSDAQRIAAEGDEKAAAVPPPPPAVQGVKVRKGLQHNPLAPVKPGEERVELNSVPDGAPPVDVAPEAPQEGDAAAPATPEGTPQPAPAADAPPPP